MTASECFLAALEVRTSAALEKAALAADGASWSTGVCRAIACLCEEVAKDPVFAKIAFVEAFSSGEEGLHRREDIMKGITERFLGSAPRDIDAIWGILHYHVTSGRARQLPRSVPTLCLLALAPVGGRSAAGETTREEQARWR